MTDRPKWTIVNAEEFWQFFVTTFMDIAPADVTPEEVAALWRWATAEWTADQEKMRDFYVEAETAALDLELKLVDLHRRIGLPDPEQLSDAEREAVRRESLRRMGFGIDAEKGGQQ